MGELRQNIEEKIGLEIHEWRLFQFAFILPSDPETKLVDCIDEKICLNLVRPEEPPRDGSHT